MSEEDNQITPAHRVTIGSAEHIAICAERVRIAKRAVPFAQHSDTVKEAIRMAEAWMRDPSDWNWRELYKAGCAARQIYLHVSGRRLFGGDVFALHSTHTYSGGDPSAEEIARARKEMAGGQG